MAQSLPTPQRQPLQQFMPRTELTMQQAVLAKAGIVRPQSQMAIRGDPAQQQMLANVVQGQVGAMPVEMNGVMPEGWFQSVFGAIGSMQAGAGSRSSAPSVKAYTMPLSIDATNKLIWAQAGQVAANVLAHQDIPGPVISQTHAGGRLVSFEVNHGLLAGGIGGPFPGFWIPCYTKESWTLSSKAHFEILVKYIEIPDTRGKINTGFSGAQMADYQVWFWVGERQVWSVTVSIICYGALVSQTNTTRVVWVGTLTYGKTAITDEDLGHLTMQANTLNKKKASDLAAGGIEIDGLPWDWIPAK